MEFSLIKVTVRYIQYIAYTVLIRDDADCVGKLIHLALEDDIHLQGVKIGSKGKSGETIHYTKLH